MSLSNGVNVEFFRFTQMISIKGVLESRLVVKKINGNYLPPIDLAGVFPGDKKDGAGDGQKKYDNQQINDCRQAVFDQMVNIEISEK